MVAICIAIGQAAGSRTLTDTELANGWASNPDGGGFAYINQDGHIAMMHFMEEGRFISEYKQAHTEHGATSPFIVHMRIATHGAIKLSTCHPFDINGHNTVFAHNGIISEMSSLTSDDVSDTMAFSDSVLSHLPVNWMDISGLTDMVGDYIGPSKLVLLTTESECSSELYIINEWFGDWDGDIWFSNTSCKTKKWSYTGGWEPLNGKFVKQGVVTPKVLTDYADLDDPWVLYQANELAGASGQELYDITTNCVRNNVYCVVCTGINECFCSDKCSTCYELYTYCPCEGDFKSLDQLYEGTSVSSDYAEVVAGVSASSDYGWVWGE